MLFDEFSEDPGYRHLSLDIVHSPGICYWCDSFPMSQRRRIKLGVNFTDTFDSDKLPCPHNLRKFTARLLGEDITPSAFHSRR